MLAARTGPRRRSGSASGAPHGIERRLWWRGLCGGGAGGWLWWRGSGRGCAREACLCGGLDGMTRGPNADYAGNCARMQRKPP